MKNRALTPASFRPKVKTANCDELAANTSRPILMVDVVGSFFFSLFQMNFRTHTVRKNVALWKR
jgi:hypothetical protein